MRLHHHPLCRMSPLHSNQLGGFPLNQHLFALEWNLPINLLFKLPRRQVPGKNRLGDQVRSICISNPAQRCQAAFCQVHLQFPEQSILRNAVRDQHHPICWDPFQVLFQIAGKLHPAWLDMLNQGMGIKFYAQRAQPVQNMRLFKRVSRPLSNRWMSYLKNI